MAKPKGERYRISVDFDGVLHSYTTPWTRPDEIPDPPVEGAIEWLREMDRNFELVIFTTRASVVEGMMAVRRWLFEHGAPSHMRITNEKVQSLIYIDDRAWRFEGRFPSKTEIHLARPWNRPKPSCEWCESWKLLEFIPEQGGWIHWMGSPGTLSGLMSEPCDLRRGKGPEEG